MSYDEGFNDELIAHAALLSTTLKPILVVGEYTNTTPSACSREEDYVKSNTDCVKANRLVMNELLSCDRSALQFLSGVIFFEGAFYRMSTSDGTPFVEVMEKSGVLVGIQLDKGTIELAGAEGEATTRGFYHLPERCKQYRSNGIRFAKWRAVFKIGPNLPSQLAINENANGLARFAKTCQVNGLVPIIEPEILAGGSHDIRRCADVTERVLAACYKALGEQHVLLKGTLLRCNMVTPGSESADKVSPEVIAEHTARALLKSVPKVVPAVVFLSGGQSVEEVRLSVNMMSHPWLLSCSFASTVQDGTFMSGLRRWCRSAAAAELE